MYQNEALKTHIEQNSSISVESFVYAEINMNDAANIKTIGNYKNRPDTDPAIPASTSFAVETEQTSPSLRKYYGYTDSDVVVDGGYSVDNIPAAFVSVEEKKKLLFSLEDCFLKFRPRSGINKAVAYGSTAAGHYIHSSGSSMMNRPRYYIADKNDKFKYWTSYRKEAVTATDGTISEVERGISKATYDYTPEGGGTTRSYYITDAAPFIVYENQIPVNRIILKMQTHVGTVKLDSSFDGTSPVSDPLYEIDGIISNRRTPINWRVEYLDVDGVTWKTLINFASLYPTGYYQNSAGQTVPVVSRDGYVELQYNNGWSIGSSEITSSTPVFTEFTNINSSQFKYIKGIRVVVDTMNRKDSTFDLIEISPRLAMNISSIVKEYSVNKVASDLSDGGLPVGQLLASNGSMTIADFDQILNKNNQNSVIADYLGNNLQIKFFEIIKDVSVDGLIQDFYVPIKTLYAESFPEINSTTRVATIKLRDLYFYLESTIAPEVFFSNISFSYAIAMVLDSIGFTNYIYYKSPNDEDMTIPYFFIAPNTSVAEVLEDLAKATQTSIFFDEYNNLVFMSKSYILPSSGDRLPDSPTSEISLVLNGSVSGSTLPNIKDISSQQNQVYNDGKIIYTSRYIQKQYREVRQANLLDEGKIWSYLPAMLWEVAPNESPKSINEVKTNNPDYALTAIPINSKLTADVPVVNENGEIVNNIIDFGEGVYFIARYSGYFHSNGEIIKYDAVEYSISQPSESEILSTTTNIVQGQDTLVVSGDLSTVKVGQRLSKVSGNGRLGNGAVITAVDTNASTITMSVNHTASGSISVVARNPETNKWITSLEEYQKYFAQLPFNGKMYPTGRVRIFSEPYYNSNSTLKVGPVARHGRGQFNTKIVEHNSGMPDWVTQNVNGISMEADYVFNNSSQDFIKVSTNAICASGSDVIKVSDADKQKLRVGQKVTGPAGVPAGTKVAKIVANGAKIDKALTSQINSGVSVTFSGVRVYDSSLIDFQEGITGQRFGGKTSKSISETATRTSLIRNFLSSSFSSETPAATTIHTTETAKVQASALVFTGPTFPTDVDPKNFISYSYKDFSSGSGESSGKYNHFGTRVRIIGTPENSTDAAQSITGSMNYYAPQSRISNSETVIKGGGGGIGVLVNPTTNNGYFFEIGALSTNNIEEYIDGDDIVNLMFYKTTQKSDSTTTTAVPVRLWSGRTSINVDDGRFTGQYRLKAEERPSVYDLAVEYEEISDSSNKVSLKFYLYINNKLVGSVIDDEPLTNRVPTVALFVRGTSKCMFENVYAIKQNEAANYGNPYVPPLYSSSTFTNEEISDNAFVHYTMPQAVSATYLNGISPISVRSADLAIDEFGTIMREAAYFNIRYDKAYPAFLAKLAPTYNNLKGYAVSGFISNAYGAEFLVFNITDKMLSLDSSTGNALIIQGVTFTQQSPHDLTVDEYFQENSNMSNPEMFGTIVVKDPLASERNYKTIKNSRITYGRKEFTLDSLYIQSQDYAENLMGWIISKILQPRLSVGVEIFANPMIQLGDIVTINYQSGGIDAVSDSSKRYVVYSINYERSSSGPNMTLYLAEAT